MENRDAIELPQTWDPARYIANARFVAELGAPVVELLAPAAGERILDLGCGDGFLTRKLADLGCSVVGIDAVFSNATLHWMKDPDAAIDSAWRALKPGGRFVGECGGEGCVAKVRGGLERALARRGLRIEDYNPWYFASAGEYAGRLRARGFEVESCVVFPRPTPLPGDVRAWLETFGESFLKAVPPSDRGAMLDEIRDDLRPLLQGADGKWTADYTRLRFRATRRLPP